MSSNVSFMPSGTDVPVGVGLKSQHFSEVLADRPSLSFFEVHAENFMSPGGAHHRYLEEITKHYALSVHGVGMSLGSADGLDIEHLNRFKEVVDRYNPVLVSEHLSWSVNDGFYLNDLLPLPLNKHSLLVVADNIKHMQDHVGRQILVENPSAYMEFVETDMPEPEYLATLAEQTGCGLLLDVNNVFVSGTNMQWDIDAYLKAFATEHVSEIHLAGHAVKDIDGTVFRVDDHGSAVCKDVWDLYAQLIAVIGPKPTLIEWDNNIPPFGQLMEEAQKAQQIMQEARAEVQEARYG